MCLLTLAARPLRPLGGRCSGPLTALLQKTPEGKPGPRLRSFVFFGGGGGEGLPVRRGHTGGVGVSRVTTSITCLHNSGSSGWEKRDQMPPTHIHPAPTS